MSESALSKIFKVFLGLLDLVLGKDQKERKERRRVVFVTPPKFNFVVKILTKIEQFIPFIPSNFEKTQKSAQDVPKSDLFGPQDQVLEGLAAFEKGYEPKKVGFMGKVSLNEVREKNLARRKQVMEYVISNPSISEIKINKPIFITGMTRTGTTLLFNLMNQDPRTRSPRFWEIYQANDEIVPPPQSPEDQEKSKYVKKDLESLDQAVPGYLKKTEKSHKIGPFEIEECTLLMMHQGMIITFLPFSPSYLEWYCKMDKEFVYKYHRRLLQTLSSGYSPSSHWSLKSPFHSLFLPLLLKEFPDASIVCCHRDPKVVVPSTCKMMEEVMGHYFNDGVLKKEDFGKSFLDLTSKMAERMVETKKTIPSERIHHVNYNLLVQDPIKMVKEIYDKFGYEMTDEFEEKMKVFLSQHPQKKGKDRNSYSLEEYSLDPKEVERRFAEYSKTFGV